MKPTFHALQVVEVRRETNDCVSISFDVPKDLMEVYRFEPGQYLTLKKMINGEDVRRSYSICAGLNDQELRVAVKKVPEGKFSTFANEDLKAGDSLDVMTPMGSFVAEFDENTEKSFVFFAAGSGITPILSLTKSILEKAPKSDVTLFYGNKGIDSVIFREQLESLKNEHMGRFGLVHIFSRESIGNKLQKGRLDKDKVQALHKAFLTNQSVDEIYVCGPEPMIYAVSETFEELGLSKDKIHFELFTTPSERNKTVEQPTRNEPSVHANVKIILDGEETLIALDTDGDSILEAGQKAGADLPFACKGGVCCTCRAKILEGTAKMDVNYALEKDEVENGYILTCQSHPTSDKLVVSFDD